MTSGMDAPREQREQRMQMQTLRSTVPSTEQGNNNHHRFLPSISHGSRALGQASDPSSVRRGAATGPVSTEHPCPPLARLSLSLSPRPRRPLPSRRHGLRYFPFSPPCASLFHRWPVVASPGVCCCWFGSWTFADIGFLNRVCDPLLQFSSFFSRLFNCWPPGQLRI